MSDIVVFTNNDIYRLGDAIMADWYSSKLLTCKSYKATFLHQYLLNKNIRDVESLGILNNTIIQNEKLPVPQRLKIVAITLSEMIQTGIWEMPKPDELVVHLRLGDVIASKEGSENHSEKIKWYANYDETIEKIRDSNKKKVVIVTAMHYQSPGNAAQSCKDVEVESLQLSMSTTSPYNKSMLLLHRLKDEVTKMGKSVEIRSSRNVDADFVYLCFSNELVLSGVSGFGMTAYHQHSFIMGHERSLVNSCCEQDWVDLVPKILWSLRSYYENNINS
jgi:hypothetical protein